MRYSNICLYKERMYLDIESAHVMVIMGAETAAFTLSTIRTSKCLPLLWGVCFPLPDLHISASSQWPPAAEPQCRLKSGPRHPDAPWQIWEELVKESTASSGLRNQLNSEHFSLLLFTLSVVGGELESKAQLNATPSDSFWFCVYSRRILQSIVGLFLLFVQSHQNWNPGGGKRRRRRFK